MSRIGGVGSEVGPIEVVSQAQPKEVDGASKDFTKALGEAIKGLDEQQTAADQESAKLAMGAGNLHETALALEKADLTMRVATKVRNRMVDAYTEIMRMSI
ncbi:MAG: flagellar hook-basal body complex protein FliE [Deltaproteobacteria bacterium]|nr:flagellar hook-basal body complex protein FliE [Deltaproteobacteria bacterium]